MDSKKTKFTTNFPKNFIRSLKIEAMDKGIPVNELIMQVFEERKLNNKEED